MSNDELPKAVVVQEGKVGGDVPPERPKPPAPKAASFAAMMTARFIAVVLLVVSGYVFKSRGFYAGLISVPVVAALLVLLWHLTHRGRKLTNFLLDKRLQLRYLAMVTVMSVLIAGTLGTLIYIQQHDASEDVTAGIAQLGDADLVAAVKADMARRDRDLVVKMALAALGLTVILSFYLLVMTHKVAGPLFKCALYFDKMKAGKLGKVTALRKGDMLADFYDGFREMHEAVRGRQLADNAAMRKFLDACDAAGVERSGALGDELDELERHVTTRKKHLADFPA